MIVVGKYDEMKNLINSFSNLNIVFVGHIPQDELKSYLSTSDIYLFPSLGEGCASSGMEALAAGLPVVATVESGLPIKNLQNGLIVESNNSDDVVKAILLLFEDKKIREKLGKNASFDISQNYKWSNYAENMRDIYNN